MENDDGWFERNYRYLKDTMAPDDPNDSNGVKLAKSIGFGMFIILLVCGSLAIVFAASFMH